MPESLKSSTEIMVVEGGGGGLGTAGRGSTTLIQTEPGQLIVTVITIKKRAHGIVLRTRRKSRRGSRIPGFKFGDE